MEKSLVLTVAVPVYNMEKWLAKNLRTYCAKSLVGKIEVLVLNNASEDRSKEIIEEFCRNYPELFRLCDRSSRGYGSSINEAVRIASGRYFRIVDADDWVDTGELERLVGLLGTCGADLVQTDYSTVSLRTGESKSFSAASAEIAYGALYHDLGPCIKWPPCIHSTTFRTSILRDSGFRMQDKLFFVDEEYVVLPCLYIKSVIFYNCNVYRYQISDPGQSTSPANRAKYRGHREKILRRLIHEYQKEKAAGRLSESTEQYAFFRIAAGVGDHFTTLLMYVSDRRAGWEEAKSWSCFLKREAPEFIGPNRKKMLLLELLNRFHVTISSYERLKSLLRAGHLNFA